LNEQKDMQKQNDIQRTQQREQTIEHIPVVEEKKEVLIEKEPVKKIDTNQLDAAVLPEAIQTAPVEKQKPVKKAAVRRTPRKTPVVKDPAKEEIPIKVEPASQEPEAS